MTPFQQFILSFGVFGGLTVIMISWFFARVKTHILLKIGLISALAIFVCWVPFTVSALLGYPVFIEKQQLPKEMQMIAFYPHDKEKLVDLWIVRAGESFPRSFQMVLTPELKKALEEGREASAKKGGGGVSMILKKKTDKGQNHNSVQKGDDRDEEQLQVDTSREAPMKE